MDSEDCKVGGKRMRIDSESKPSVIFSEMASIQHPQQASDMECEVVGHSVEVESSSVSSPVVDLQPSPSSNGEQPTVCVEGAETNIPTLCDSMECPAENRRHETKTLDDTSDIDIIIHHEPSKISVKTLRVVVPRMRVVCYSKEEEICGKKKMKNLWNDRPIDWPSQVPFKDPNNKGTEGRKATKEELVAMFDFLREKYLSMPRQCAVEEVWSHEQEPTQTETMKEEPSDATYYQHPSTPKVETPFRQLLERCEEKANRLLAGVDDPRTINLVKQVFDDILVPLFKGSSVMAAGCEFLDAGHQLETLLDVGLAYGKETMHVLSQGCQELIDKFYPARDAGTQSAPIVQIFTARNQDPTPRSLAPATGEHWGLNLRPNVSYDRVQQLIDTRPEAPTTLSHNNTEKDDLLKTAVDQCGINKVEAVPVQGGHDLWDDVLDMFDDHHKKESYSEPAVQISAEPMEVLDASVEQQQNVYPPQPFSFQDFLNSDTDNFTFMNEQQEQQQQRQPSMVLGPCSPPMGSPQGAIPTTVEDMAEDQQQTWRC